MPFLVKVIGLLVCSLLVFSESAVRAQGTAFIYQGHLLQSGAAANGLYDMVFTVYDSASVAETNVIAGPLTNTAVPITNGMFMTTVDFGQGVFNGDARWLEIALRTNGATGFVTLAGRQMILATPYAITSANAQNVLGLLPMSNMPPSLAALTKGTASPLTNLMQISTQISGTNNVVLGIPLAGGLQWLNAPALNAVNMSNIPGSALVGPIPVSVSMSNSNTWVGQNFNSASFTPTNTYFGTQNGVTNISVVGSNSTGIFVLRYAPGVPHLKMGDQFNPFWFGGYNSDQEWIDGLTNNGPYSDIVQTYNQTGNTHTWTIPTNLFISPAAAQIMDNTVPIPNQAASIGGDGTITVWGNTYGGNSAKFVWGNGYYTYASFINNDSDGDGVYWTLSGGHENYGQLAVCFNAPHKSIDLLSTGDVKFRAGSLIVGNAGSSITVQSGTNAKIGTASANGTNAVVVSTTAVTTNSLIFLTEQTPSGTPGAPYVTSTTPGSGFTFRSTSGADTSKVGWWIVEKE